MGAVLSLAEHKAAAEPHLQGRARCAGCRHEWQAVAPVGTTVLECPECSSMKGFFVCQVERGENFWQCNCGNDLFRITEGLGPYCINCGSAATGWF